MQCVQALNSNPLGQPVPVPGPASSAGLSFSYKIPQTGLGFPGNQQLQSSVVSCLFNSLSFILEFFSQPSSHLHGHKLLMVQ